MIDMKIRCPRDSMFCLGESVCCNFTKDRITVVFVGPCRAGRGANYSTVIVPHSVSAMFCVSALCPLAFATCFSACFLFVSPARQGGAGKCHTEQVSVSDHFCFYGDTGATHTRPQPRARRAYSRDSRTITPPSQRSTIFAATSCAAVPTTHFWAMA